MRVAYAIPVRHIEVLKDGSLGAMGIETAIYQAPLPTSITAPLVIALAGSHVEAQAEVQHRLQIRVVAPDLSEAAAPMDAGFAMSPGPNTPEGWEVRSIFPLVCPVRGASDWHVLD